MQRIAASPRERQKKEPVLHRQPLRRFGIFGGTFDPVHFGHLRPALEVSEMFGLNTIFWIPAAIPPHKRTEALTPPESRMKMVELAIGGNGAFNALDMELKRNGPSYTIDTIDAFKRTFAKEAETFLLLGLDAFFDIRSWRRYKEILDAVSLIVMDRWMPPAGHDEALLPRMGAFLKEIVSEGYRLDPDHGRLVHPEMPAVYLAGVTRLDISSTRIRQLVRSGRSIEFLVPEAVRRYILQKGLYL